MKVTKLLVLALLAYACVSQATSLVDFLKGGGVGGGTGGNGGGAGDTSSDDFAPSDSFVPCGNKESCGEAQSFKNEKEFKDFVGKYAQKPTSQTFTPASLPTAAPAPVPAPLPTPPRTQALQVRPAQTVKDLRGGALNDVSTVSFNAFAAPTTFFSPPAAASAAPQAFAFKIVAPPVDPTVQHSDTNNQVENVDEADLLKTDGTYIYTISNQILSIILAYPSNKAKVMSTLNFKDFNPSALFLEGDYLAVFGTKWVTETDVFVSYSIAYTYIKIYDVSNRAKPFLIRQFQVSGRYFDGRKLNNGFMYLVTSQSFSYIPKPIPWFDFGGGRRDVDISSIFWYPRTVYVNPSAVNIISFDLSNPINSRKKVVTICAEDARVMYMSQSYIYLTTTSYEFGQQYTNIRKIYVKGRYIRPFADARVLGYIKNQFSLDEYGQFLRIATTSFDSGVSTNNVFVLNYFLRPYGSLTDVARTETIFSCRYVGKRLYLVTFRRTDPFFVISLRNHRAPKILGELKVTGFSNYLHPYDETTIIGLGRQADFNGRQLGLKISLFDVSDVNNPIESVKFEIEEKYAYSNAEWEHKAFLFSADKNLLVIPGYMDYDGTRFNGAFAFYIDKSEITLKAAIDHLLNPADNFYDRNVERSLWIEDLLYTKSKCLLRINEISDTFDGVKNINISC